MNLSLTFGNNDFFAIENDNYLDLPLLSAFLRGKASNATQNRIINTEALNIESKKLNEERQFDSLSEK